MRIAARAFRSLLFALGLGLTSAANAATIDWVSIGDPGNAADTTGFGAVAQSYQIAKTEVTNAQYTEFLNAKAASDPFGLYNANMALSYGGIIQSGSSGSFSYSTIAGREDKPVVYVSFFDALRFANWMNNGQGSGDTETGAYTLLGGSAFPSNGSTVMRNASASIWLTSEDEWYKAAYYDAVASIYHSDPFADGLASGCEAPPGATSHAANCYFTVGNTADVGSYAGSPSASGTFDQGGNVDEWNEAIVGSNRSLRGGSWRSLVSALAATSSSSSYPSVESDYIGFRLAAAPVPEPTTGLLLGFGLSGLAWARRASRACGPRL